MKRTKFLVLALVVAVMLMGAGYAYWQEELTISNTVDTGDLDVVFQEPEETQEDDYTGQNVSTIQNDPHKLKVELVDVYPGAEIKLYFNLENIGTLGAYVDDFAIVEGADERVNQILCSEIIVDGKSVPNIGKKYTLEKALTALNRINEKNGIFLDSSYKRGGAEDKIKKQVEFKLQINPEATNTSLLQNRKFSFQIGANVHQYNGR